MVKKLLYTFIILLLALILLVNVSFLRFFFPHTYPHRYCADKGNFCTLERGKGHNTLGSVYLDFEAYKQETKQPNLVLHRRFYRKWWQIWNWYDFFTADRWDIPYADRDEDT